MLAKEVKQVLSITQSELNSLVNRGFILTTYLAKNVLDYNPSDVMAIKAQGYRNFITQQAKAISLRPSISTDKTTLSYNPVDIQNTPGPKDRFSCHNPGCHPARR